MILMASPEILDWEENRVDAERSYESSRGLGSKRRCAPARVCL